MRTMTSLLCVAAALLSAAVASADPISLTHTLTFDGLATESAVSLDDYGGLTWDNIRVFNPAKSVNEVHPNSGYWSGTVSGDSVAFNPNGEPASVMGGTFTFDSAYFTAAWRPGLNLDIKAYAGGAEVFSALLILDPSAPLFFAPNWAGIDRLSFVTTGGRETAIGEGFHFALDNFTFTAPVPEPSSLMLLGTGFVAALAMRRRRAH